MDDPDIFEEIDYFGIKGLDSDMHYDVGDIIELSVEFLLPDEDSFTYLTAELVKEASGWKVDWYGLEK